jgi:hypothetical protein
MSCNIPAFLTYVRSEYLYSLNEGFGYFAPATVFAISSRSGESLKFQIIVDDKVMFSNIPICALANSKTAPKMTEEECIYNMCSDDDANIIQYDFLSNIEHCSVWNRDNTYWQKGIYLFTVEWHKSKEQGHIIELEDGNYVCWPNQKITWGEEIPDKLPEYTGI